MDELSRAVYQAVGQASTCWDDLANAGTYKPQLASKIADELLIVIQRITEAEWKARQQSAGGGGGGGSNAGGVGVGVDTKPWSTPG